MLAGSHMSFYKKKKKSHHRNNHHHHNGHHSHHRHHGPYSDSSSDSSTDTPELNPDDDMNDSDDEVDESTMKNFMKLRYYIGKVYDIPLPSGEWRFFELTWYQKLFVYITEPNSSMLSLVYSYIMLGMITLGVVTVIISSMNQFQYAPSSCLKPACDNDPDLCPGITMCAPLPLPVFQDIDAAIVAFFTLDFIVRVSLVSYMPPRLTGVLSEEWDFYEQAAAEKKGREKLKDPVMTQREILSRFLLSTGTAIDLVAVLPFYVFLGVHSDATATSFIRVFRVFRVFKLFKGFSGIITVFNKTFYASKDALIILGFIILVADIILGCILFAIENGEYIVNADNPQGGYYRRVDGTNELIVTPYDSIPTAMYWAIVTLTTVGYGDLTPVTSMGRAFACFTAIGGVVCIALPVTVIGTNFTKEYDAYFEKKAKFRALKQVMMVRNMRDRLSRLPSVDELKTIAKKNRRRSVKGKSITEFSMSDLTDKQLKDMRKAFNVFDADRSGMIGLKEMKTAFRALGFVLTKEKLEKIVSECDEDGSGDINFDEFMIIMTGLLNAKYDTALSPSIDVSEDSPRSDLSPRGDVSAHPGAGESSGVVVNTYNIGSSGRVSSCFALDDVVTPDADHDSDSAEGKDKGKGQISEDGDEKRGGKKREGVREGREEETERDVMIGISMDSGDGFTTISSSSSSSCSSSSPPPTPIFNRPHHTTPATSTFMATNNITTTTVTAAAASRGGGVIKGGGGGGGAGAGGGGGNAQQSTLSRLFHTVSPSAHTPRQPTRVITVGEDLNEMFSEDPAAYTVLPTTSRTTSRTTSPTTSRTAVATAVVSYRSPTRPNGEAIDHSPSPRRDSDHQQQHQQQHHNHHHRQESPTASPPTSSPPSASPPPSGRERGGGRGGGGGGTVSNGIAHGFKASKGKGGPTRSVSFSRQNIIIPNEAKKFLVSTTSHSHEELVAYTNQLIIANLQLVQSIASVNDVLTYGGGGGGN